MVASRFPSHAKKVFTAHAYSVYERDQVVFDNSIKPFFGIQRQDAVKIVAVVDGSIVLSDEIHPHEGPKTKFFGWLIEDGEDPLEAAKREFLEETGMIATVWEPLGQVYDKNVHSSYYYFLAKNCKVVALQNLEPGEHITIKKVTFEELVTFISKKFPLSSPFSFLETRIDPDLLEEFRKRLFS